MRAARGAATNAEARFHAEMTGLYDRCAALGFRPVLLRRYVVLNGGVKAARDLVFKPGTTGLERLLDLGRPELSMEAAMLKPEYRGLFTEAELKQAAERLANAGRSRSRGRLQAAPTTRDEPGR